MRTRVLQYFFYNKSRSVLQVFLLVFAITTLIVTDSTNLSFEETINYFEAKNPLIMTIKPNNEMFRNDFPDANELGEDERIELLLEHVILDKSLIDSLSEIEEVMLVEAYKTAMGYLTSDNNTVKNELSYYSAQEESVKLIGMSNSELNDLLTGQAILVQGEFLDKQDIDNKNHVVVINQTFAQQNNLEVGDKISILLTVEVDRETFTSVEREVNLDIVGIVQTPKTVTNKLTSTYDMLENLFYVPEFVISENTFSPLISKKEMISNIYFVVEGMRAQEFSVQYQSVIESEYMVFSSNDNSVNRAVSLIEIPRLITSMVNIYTIVILVIIVLSLELYSLNHRNNEFGILIATGHTKKDLILQLVFEKLIILFISIIVSLLLSFILMPIYGKHQFNSMLEESNNMNEYYEEEQYIKDPIDRYSIVNYDEVYTSLAFQVQMTSVFKVIGIVLGTLFLSVVVFTNRIIRLEPKEIFNNL